MQKKIILLIFVSLFFLVTPVASSAQSFSFLNPSFEGHKGMSMCPASWANGGQGGVSSVDTHPFIGTGPSVLQPSHLNTYLGMLCRADGSYEGVYQGLFAPLDSSKCYNFTIDLAYAPDYIGIICSPAKLRVWAGYPFPGSVRTELLWTSPAITDTTWQTHNVSFSPNGNYLMFLFEVYYDSPLSTPYFGNVLLDNLSYVTVVGSLPDFYLGNDTTLCQGETLMLDVTTANATYLWQDNSTNSTFNVVQQGTYWVKVTNSCGSSFDTVNVSYNPLPTIDLGNDTTLCQGETLTLDVTTPNATYLWQDNSINSTFNVTQQGIYWIEVTNSCGSSFDTINVSYNSPTINLGNDTTLCQGETLTLDVTTPNATYLWQDNSTNSTFNVAKQGTYWVEVTNSCGSSFDTINVSYNPLLNIDLGNDTTLCQGEALTLDVTTPNATYLWQDNSTNPILNVIQQGIYWIEVADGCGSSFDTINVSYNLPTIDLGNDTTLCQGETLMLDVTTANATYLWQDNSTNSTFNVAQQGIYWVEVTNSCGSSFDTINVSYTPSLNIDLGNDTTLCQGETLTLDATTQNATYLWQDNSTNPILNVTEQGTYWVEVADGCGNLSDTINVSYILSPTITLGNDTILCQGEILTLDAANSNATYLWQDNSINPTLNVAEQGTYWVEVENNCGIGFDTIVITIDDCDCILYIPNSFTPNFDNKNDHFFPIFECDITEYTFSILNRWGEIIFETNSPTNSWNGNYKGEICKTGVYIYILKYKHKGIYQKKYGNVNLLR